MGPPWSMPASYMARKRRTPWCPPKCKVRCWTGYRMRSVREGCTPAERREEHRVPSLTPRNAWTTSSTRRHVHSPLHHRCYIQSKTAPSRSTTDVERCIAICVREMRSWVVSQVCRAFVITMENDFQMTEKFGNGRPFATTPCELFFGRRVKSPKWRSSTLPPHQRKLQKFAEIDICSSLRRETMGYSLRSGYGVVGDVSDRAARRAGRDTIGMWKGVHGGLHPMM